MAAAARFWDARWKSGGASASAFAPPLARRLLSGSGARVGGVGARPRGWSAAGRCSHRESIAFLLTGLALDRHALCKLSLAWLGVHAELLV
jgi:hypothetical protein